MKLSKKIGLILVSGIILVHSLQASNLKCLSQNNTTMVPFRVIGEDLGAKVSFEQASQTITLSYRDTNIELKVGSKKATVNGEEKNLASSTSSSRWSYLCTYSFCCRSIRGRS